jgi:ubiquinone/menaquinone biosynthesis C-methylase UbiE
MSMVMNPSLSAFLQTKPVVNGTFEISPARSFQHDETDYDRQYAGDRYSIDDLKTEARHLIELCARHGLPAGAPILEIGCGTGRISVGLASQPGIGQLLITDPSPAFCRIVQRKLVDSAVDVHNVDFGILQAEDVGLLPPGSVSLIVLRSVLHHIADVDAFLQSCANVLPSGGLLVCEEPYYDGYVMMGFIGQFIEDALNSNGYECSQSECALIENFIATMQFYSRRDVDKSQAEDKHLFRPDELMASGREMGLKLTHYPNSRMTSPQEADESARIGYFQRFFADYVRYCMDWPQDFSSRVATATRKYFKFFEPLERGGNTAPWCYGTFVFTKKAL